MNEAYEANTAVSALAQFNITLPDDAQRWLTRLTELRENPVEQPAHNTVALLIADNAKPADIDRATAAHVGAQHRINQHQQAQAICGQRIIAAILADRDRLNTELATQAHELIDKLHAAATIDESVAELTKQRRTEDAELLVWVDTDVEQLRRMYFVRNEYLTPPGAQWTTGWWDCSEWQAPWLIKNPATTDSSMWSQYRASIRAGGQLWYPTWEQATEASTAHEPGEMLPPINPVRGNNSAFV
jgi:hypothetical protein